MEPLDPELRRLIDDGLAAAAPDRDAESRGLEGLLAHIDAPPVPPSIPAGPALGKLALVVATAVTAGGTWLALRSPPETAPAGGAAAPLTRAQAPSPTPPNRAPSPPPPQGQPPVTPGAPAKADPGPTAPAPRRSPPRIPAKTEPAPAPQTPADALRAEANLIAKAESALDRNKPKEALALCDFHRSGFEAPQLTTERRAIAASAACMLDPTDTRRALTFVRAHPRSALTAKVRTRCALPSDAKNSAGR